MALLGPYYYGKHKWDNYLLDIQGAIESGNAAYGRSGRSIEVQSDALEVAREQVDELRQQTEQLSHIEQALQGGFEELRAEFEWGFTLMVDRMDTQIEQLSQIAARLDAIHKTLQSPLLTQARELFQLGQEHFRKGLLDKALEAYRKAEQKNDVDFPLQLQIGKLFLYGRDEDDDIIDLPQAEKHLLLAARYADAEKGTFPQWNEYCGQAYFNAAVAAYLIGEQEQAAGRPDSMRLCLERALKYLTKAATLWPRFNEIVYTQAKCHALLGQTQDAAQKLEILSDRDRRYFARASRDGDFGNLRAAVEAVFTRAAMSPGPLARATQTKLDEVAEAVAWAKRSVPASKGELATIESIERELSNSRQSLPTLEVDIEELNERLDRMRAELDQITKRSFQNNIDASQQGVASGEARKNSCEASIEKLNQTATSGAGMGCGFAIGFLIVIFFSFSVLSDFPTLRALLIPAAIVSAAVGFVIGNNLSCRRQNLQRRPQLEEYERMKEECLRSLVQMRQRAKAWEEELSRFAVWRVQRPLPSPTPPSSRSRASLTVTLISVGANKINVIKAVREVTGFDLREAKDLVDNVPRPIKHGVDKEEAKAIARRFEAVGASVQIG
jgi:large subunit ribosomal protein L7/L12